MILKDDYGDEREYESIIDYLFDMNVVEIDKVGELFQLTEGCDRYYNAYLSKEQLICFANELLALAEKP